MQLAYFIIPAPQHRFTVGFEKENDVRLCLDVNFF